MTDTLWDDFDSGHSHGHSIDLWGLVWRRKWVILSCMILGLLAGFLYYYSATPFYQSSANVLIERKQPPLQVGEMAMRVDRYETIADTMKHPIVMQSPQIASTAYDDHRLEQCLSLKEFESPVGAILTNLSVESIQDGLGVYEVSFIGTDRQDTQKIVQAVIDTYKDFLVDMHASVGVETRNLITNGKDELSRQLRTKEELYTKFRAESPLMLNLHQDRQASIEATRAATQLEISQIESQLKSIKESLRRGENLQGILMMAQSAFPNSTQPVGLVDRYEFQRQLQTRQAEQQLVVRAQSTMMPLKLQEEELLSRYGKDHPQVKSVKRSLAEAKKYLDELAEVEKQYIERNQDYNDGPELEQKLQAWRRSMIRAYVDSLRQRLALAKEQFDRLDELFRAEEKAARELAFYQSKDQAMQNDIERTQNLFDSVVANLDRISLNSGDGYNFREISSPVPGIKVSPSIPKTFALSLILGSLVGGGIAFLLEKSDQSFRSPVEISRYLDVPVIGNIPIVELGDSDKTPATQNLDSVLCTAHKPRSPESEAYRTVRTAIFFDARGSNHHIIQVTSPRPGDGKSTLSANLAIAVAQGGKKTLLIDADFRRPVAHKVFGFNKPIGIASVVEGQAEPSEALTKIECVPNLWVMACGQRPENPSELLSSKQFLSTLEYLKEEFEFVIVDTPPLLAVSDPRAVAASVDAVVLTMRIDKEARPVAKRATEILNECGANLVGIVVNGVGNGKKDRTHYDYGAQTYGYNAHRYGYGSAYGYGDDYVDEQQQVTS